MKDEHEIGSLDQRERGKGEWGGRVAADFLSFGFGVQGVNVVAGGGNVKIPPVLRDFQGAVGSVENLGLVFHAFHGTGISTALGLGYRNGGGSGD